MHLVETADLNKKEIEFILDEAQKFISFNKMKIKKNNLLEGRTIFNLFLKTQQEQEQVLKLQLKD